MKTLLLAGISFAGASFACLGCGSTTNNGSHSSDEGATGHDTDTASSGNSGGSSSAGGTTGAGGASTGDSTAAGGTTSTTGTTGTTGGNCAPGIPATSQVPRLLNREYDAILHDLLGVSALASAGDQSPSALLNDDFQGELTNDAWQAYLEVADRVAAQVMASDNRSRFISCDPADGAACYENTIKSFGRKVFRRPLTDQEVDRFLALTEADPTWTPDETAEAILYAFLVSPSFIMVPELSLVTDGAAFQLSSYEVATRLSLMLWGSVPDDELDVAADQDLLATKEQVRAQAERMIASRDKAGPQVSAAHEAYVESSSPSAHWWRVTHDPESFPNFTSDSQLALQREVGAFFEEVAYEGGSFRDIFLSDIAFVNRDSAALYGLDPADFGSDLTRVELDPDQRPGFFTRAGFLSSFSSGDATNPILRGAMLTKNVLGVDVGPPDPIAIATPIPEGDYTTRREQIEALTSVQASCLGCHAIINAPGYALENFDAVGSWQSVDPLGGTIDPVAEVTFADGSVRTVDSPLALMEAIADDPSARHLYAQKLVSYFTGRAPNENDACMVDTIASNLAESGYGMLDVVVDLTQADSFRLRTIAD